MKSIQGEFPQAEVFASTFDQFVLQLSPVHDQLPVFTQEIGRVLIDVCFSPFSCFSSPFILFVLLFLVFLLYLFFFFLFLLLFYVFSFIVFKNLCEDDVSPFM